MTDLPQLPPDDRPPAGVEPIQRPGRQAPGWYPDYRNQAMERYWDGARWTGQPRPRALPMQPPPGYPPGMVPQGYAYPGQPVFVQQVNTAPRYVSGISNGGRIVHIVLTVCTVGLWAPVWIISEWLSRKRIG